MNFKKIINSDSEGFEEVWRLYESSFHPDERRELKGQIEIFDDTAYTLYAVYDKNLLVGLIGAWDLGDFIFGEHLAIREDLRDYGLGSKAIMKFIALVDKKIVGEVQKPNTSMGKRSISFLTKHGFKLNRYNYLQPPYNKGKKPLFLFLITYPKLITKAEFLKIRKKIYSKVYNYSNTRPFCSVTGNYR